MASVRDAYFARLATLPSVSSPLRLHVSSVHDEPPPPLLELAVRELSRTFPRLSPTSPTERLQYSPGTTNTSPPSKSRCHKSRKKLALRILVLSREAYNAQSEEEQEDGPESESDDDNGTDEEEEMDHADRYCPDRDDIDTEVNSNDNDKSIAMVASGGLDNIPSSPLPFQTGYSTWGSLVAAIDVQAVASQTSDVIPSLETDTWESHSQEGGEWGSSQEDKGGSWKVGAFADDVTSWRSSAEDKSWETPVHEGRSWETSLKAGASCETHLQKSEVFQQSLRTRGEPGTDIPQRASAEQMASRKIAPLKRRLRVSGS